MVLKMYGPRHRPANGEEASIVWQLTPIDNTGHLDDSLSVPSWMKRFL